MLPPGGISSTCCIQDVGATLSMHHGKVDASFYLSLRYPFAEERRAGLIRARELTSIHVVQCTGNQKFNALEHLTALPGLWEFEEAQLATTTYCFDRSLMDNSFWIEGRRERMGMLLC
jgi:hypothetical protein